MKLPYLPNTAARNEKQIVSFRGINYSDSTQDGDLKDSLNISTRRYPYLTTRRARAKQEAYSGATALSARGGLVVVQGTDLLYEGKVVGSVTEGQKQFAVVNTKLIVWPDKVYLDLNSLTMGDMGAKVSGKAATFSAEEGTMTVSGWGDLTESFKVGDCVTIAGAYDNDMDVVIKSLTENTLGVGENVFEDLSITDGYIVVERKVPDMDFICESENRLWGCCNETQTIYASALGDPTNFFVYEGLSTDSYAVAVGSEGEFTGCCKHSSSVLFWKETRMHKMLGSYPAEYTLYDYNIEGLQKGSHKSLQVINEVLYYLGTHGVYAYSGGMPSLVSAAFGEKLFTDGVAGTDGDSYYLSAWEDGSCHLMVYETTTGMWFREDATNALDFARVGKDLYMLNDQGEIWLMDTWEADPDVDWMAQFAPFHESVAGRKLFTKLILRLELPKGAWMKVETACDGGKWREACKILGRDMDSIPVQLPLIRCDRFDVRLSGHGPCTIKAMMLEYAMGSDV